MSDIKPVSPKSWRGLAIAGGVVIALLWTQMSGELMRLLAPNGIGGIAYGRSIAASLSGVIVMTVIVCMTAGIGLARIWQVSGLTASVTRPLIVHAAVFGLATVLCLTVAPLATNLSFENIAWLGFGSPITEEIVFRGLAIGALMRLAGWRFLPAIIAPAILFGVAHYAQGDGLVDSAAIIAITGLGGLVFGWLFVRWDFNLWPAIFAHIGMNTLWMVFALGENALGGWFGNRQQGAGRHEIPRRECAWRMVWKRAETWRGRALNRRRAGLRESKTVIHRQRDGDRAGQR